jgi:hypothetical protein
VLIPFALGFAVVALLEIVAAFSIYVVVDSHDWASFDVRFGPALLFAYDGTGRVSALTLGSGVLVVAAVAGLVNAAGAAALQRRI